MIIKTHIKLMLNMYNLFSKFYYREKEIPYDGELKNIKPKCMNPKQRFKNHNDSSIKSRVARKKNQERERKNNHFFKRECE